MSGKKGRYHHGDLRAALVREAIRALDDEPDAEITLRGLAKGLGVSPMAPYAHFDDKDALMDAVAVEGFGALAKSLAVALGGPGMRSDPDRALEALGKAYVSFGLARPGLYRVMFARPARPRGHPVREAGEAAFEPLASVFADRGTEARHCAEIAWSFVHGLTLLIRTGFIEAGEESDRHIEWASEAFARR